MALLSNGTKGSSIRIHLIVKLTVLFACTVVYTASQNILVPCMGKNGETKFQIPTGLKSLFSMVNEIKHWFITGELTDVVFFSFLLTLINLTKHIMQQLCILNIKK